MSERERERDGFETASNIGRDSFKKFSIILFVPFSEPFFFSASSSPKVVKANEFTNRCLNQFLVFLIHSFTQLCWFEIQMILLSMSLLNGFVGEQKKLGVVSGKKILRKPRVGWQCQNRIRNRSRISGKMVSGQEKEFREKGHEAWLKTRSSGVHRLKALRNHGVLMLYFSQM